MARPVAEAFAGALAAGNVGGQALALGLVDEVAMDVVPVVFGSGKRYFSRPRVNGATGGTTPHHPAQITERRPILAARRQGLMPYGERSRRSGGHPASSTVFVQVVNERSCCGGRRIP